MHSTYLRTQAMLYILFSFSIRMTVLQNIFLYCIINLFISKSACRGDYMFKKIINRICSLRWCMLLLILLLCRLPYLIAYYPGMMIYDTGSSIAQFFGYKTHVVTMSTTPNAILSNHHMILLTFLMGGAVKIGDMLNNQNLGFFLYTLTQVILTNSIVAYGLTVIRNKCRPIVYVISLILYAFLPIFSLWQLAISKDALFSAFALLLLILFYQIVESKGKILSSKKFLLLLFVTNLMLILTKPQGVYISLLSFCVIAFVFRKHWLKFLCIGVLPAIFYITIFTGVLLPALNVATSGKQEMFGFAFQQTARYVRDHGDEVTEEQKETIDAILPYDELAELYSPTSQDPVKFTYKQNAPGDALGNYLKVWLEMFAKHPGTYIAATAENIKHFFIPDTKALYSYRPLLIEYSDILNEHEFFTLSNTKPQPIYYIVALVIDILATNPITMLFFQPCFYVWITIIGITLLLIKKNFYSLLAFTPIVISLLILIIAPIVDTRYILQLIYCAPLLYAIIFRRKDTA